MINVKSLIKALQVIAVVMTVIFLGCGVVIPLVQMTGNYILVDMLINVCGVSLVLSLFSFIIAFGMEV